MRIILSLFLANAMAGAATAATVQIASCSLTVPNNWSVANGTAANPGQTISLTLDEVGDGLVSLSLEQASGGKAIINQPNLKVLQISDTHGNMRYLAISAPIAAPACRVQLMAAGATNFDLARSVVAGLKRTK